MVRSASTNSATGFCSILFHYVLAILNVIKMLQGSKCETCGGKDKKLSQRMQRNI